jgi:hypothetical protein
VFEPRQQESPAVVQLRVRWASRHVRTRDGTRQDARYDFHVAARERLALPCGEFEAFRVEGEGFDQRGTRRTLVHWIVPGVNYSLRSESTAYDPRTLRVTYAERREMVSCRQMRWSQA